jgi:hypothetical protein
MAHVLYAADHHLAVLNVFADDILQAQNPRLDAWLAQAMVSRLIDPTDVGPSIRAARKALRSFRLAAEQMAGVSGLVLILHLAFPAFPRAAKARRHKWVKRAKAAR